MLTLSLSTSSSTSSREPTPSPVPMGKQCCKCCCQILANKLYFNIALGLFFVFCCIILSFNLPEEYQKTLAFQPVEEFSVSMERACMVLFVLNAVYLIASTIVRKRTSI